MSFEEELDVVACARRVVDRLRPPSELREDLIQQAVVLSYEILRRFQPRAGVDAPPPLVQAERYLLVTLRWNLRAYARRLRSLVPVPDSDRRLARAYGRLITTRGSLTVAEAARELGVEPKRLAAALAASDQTISLDGPVSQDADGSQDSLGARVATHGPGPEELFVAAVDEEQAALRRALIGRVVQSSVGDSAKERRRQARRILYLLLDQLPHGSAEVIRLAFALPRKELSTLRSCRTYGCRQDDGHEHTPREIARWLEGDEPLLVRHRRNGLDRLSDLLGGRDPRRLLREVSAMAVPSAAAETAAHRAAVGSSR